MSSFTPDDARELARSAHTGQTDKLGAAYVDHVHAVGSGLIDFDDTIQVAGFLHDIVEDTGHTLDSLRSLGVSERSLAIIERVLRNLHPDMSYAEGIAHVSESEDAALVKISDNVHNSHPDRVRALVEATGEPPAMRYAEARPILFAAVRRDHAEKILRRVNPSLAPELG